GMEVNPASAVLASASLALSAAIAATTIRAADSKRTAEVHTSHRCVACHNGMRTASGEDMSIGVDWRASMMANSSRDPYWQASVRRETIDHPNAAAQIEDDCAVCHMPIVRYEAKVRGERARIFAHFPFDKSDDDRMKAADGVSCSVCHQVSTEKLGKIGRAN